MPIVTPNPTRRSTRTIVRPTRLGDDSSVRESTARNDPPEHDLMADASAVNNDPTAAEKVPVETIIAVDDTVDDDEASESSNSSSTSNRNPPFKNYSRSDLYDKLILAKEAYKELKLAYSAQERELKATRKELGLLERKSERLDMTESKLRRACQDLHQAKVDKKVLADKVKSVTNTAREVESSKKALKDSLKAKYKLEEQQKQLVHDSAYAKLQHDTTLNRARSEILLSNQDEKIKRLEGEIHNLKGKARQYDAIAATGIKTVISLNAFEKRANQR